MTVFNVIIRQSKKKDKELPTCKISFPFNM